MRIFQCFLFVLKRSYIFYYIICMTVPLTTTCQLNFSLNCHNLNFCYLRFLLILEFTLLKYVFDTVNLWALDEDVLWTKEFSILCEKCPYLNIFWSVFSRIRTQYGEIQSFPPYSVQMPENTDQHGTIVRTGITCKKISL